MIIPHRKPNRLKKFNYSTSGYYYVTICTKDRQEYFGNIINNEMVLNKYGEIVEYYWLEIPKHFPDVELNEFAIMPNHFHGIIIIRNSNQPVINSSVGNDPRVVPNNNKRVVPIINNQVGHGGPTLQNTRQQQLLFKIIKCFKTITTNIYIDGVEKNQFPRFDKRIWQKSYYDHIIRNEYSLNRIRQYIKDNLQNWGEDRNNTR